MTKNIIQFPIERRMDAIAWAELERKTQVKDDDVVNDEQQSMIEHLIQVVVDEMVAEGYGVDGEEFIYDVSFLYETIKSLVLKMDGHHHPVQDFAANLYESYYDEVAESSLQLSFDF